MKKDFCQKFVILDPINILYANGYRHFLKVKSNQTFANICPQNNEWNCQGILDKGRHEFPLIHFYILPALHGIFGAHLIKQQSREESAQNEEPQQIFAEKWLNFKNRPWGYPWPDQAEKCFILIILYYNVTG